MIQDLGQAGDSTFSRDRSGRCRRSSPGTAGTPGAGSKSQVMTDLKLLQRVVIQAVVGTSAATSPTHGGNFRARPFSGMSRVQE